MVKIHRNIMLSAAVIVHKNTMPFSGFMIIDFFFVINDNIYTGVGKFSGIKILRPAFLPDGLLKNRRITK